MLTKDSEKEKTIMGNIKKINSNRNEYSKLLTDHQGVMPTSTNSLDRIPDDIDPKKQAQIVTLNKFENEQEIDNNSRDEANGENQAEDRPKSERPRQVLAKSGLYLRYDISSAKTHKNRRSLSAMNPRIKKSLPGHRHKRSAKEQITYYKKMVEEQQRLSKSLQQKKLNDNQSENVEVENISYEGREDFINLIEHLVSNNKSSAETELDQLMADYMVTGTAKPKAKTGAHKVRNAKLPHLKTKIYSENHQDGGEYGGPGSKILETSRD